MGGVCGAAAVCGTGAVCEVGVACIAGCALDAACGIGVDGSTGVARDAGVVSSVSVVGVAPVAEAGFVPAETTVLSAFVFVASAGCRAAERATSAGVAGNCSAVRVIGLMTLGLSLSFT